MPSRGSEDAGEQMLVFAAVELVPSPSDSKHVVASGLHELHRIQKLL